MARSGSVVLVPPNPVATASVTMPESSEKVNVSCAFFWFEAVVLVVSLLMTIRAKAMTTATGMASVASQNRFFATVRRNSNPTTVFRLCCDMPRPPPVTPGPRRPAEDLLERCSGGGEAADHHPVPHED